MSVDMFRGRKMAINDVVIYRCSVPAQENEDAPRQHKENGPYIGKIVDFTNMSICVRVDGVKGKEPLYHISVSDIIRVEPSFPGKVGGLYPA